MICRLCLGISLIALLLSTNQVTAASVYNDLSSTANTTLLPKSNTTQAAPPQGWTSQPNGRGTIDIIWQCNTTIFLCCWSVLCLNVPPSDWGRWRWFIQKFCMACLGVIGPEFIFQLALGQWASARRSVGDFKRLGYSQWTMRHAFLADMGGFVLHPPDFVEFVLDAKQVHYLVEKGYIPYSAIAIDPAVIKDKNKTDGIGRFLTVIQILWFTLNCLGRVTQHLAITTFELTTLGFIICTLGTCFFWAHKPMDVTIPIVLIPNAKMADILKAAGDKAREPYKFTPLDFVSGNKSSWNLYWTFWMRVVRNLGIEFGSKRRPITHIQDDNFPMLSRGSSIVPVFATCLFASVHLAAWNFHFATEIERILWKISAVGTTACVVLYWLSDWYAWHLHPALKHCFTTSLSRSQLEDPESGILPKTSERRRRFLNAAASLKYNSEGHDPALGIPLKALIPITVLGAVYWVFRGYILLEDFISLRSQPLSAYESISWSGFIPHL